MFFALPMIKFLLCPHTPASLMLPENHSRGCDGICSLQQAQGMGSLKPKATFPLPTLGKLLKLPEPLFLHLREANHTTSQTYWEENLINC